MIPRMSLAVGALLLLLTLMSRATELQIFAAASLLDVLSELAPAYEKNTGGTLRFNFAGSHVLARQILQGAQADVFLSADEAKMDGLEKSGALLAGARQGLLSNALVVVIDADSTLDVQSAQQMAQPAIKRIALADTQAVPAGIYAREHLQQTGAWNSVKPRVVPTENVRAAMAAVEAGNADAAIVYKTDAAQSKSVRIAFEVPSTGGPKISYPVLVHGNRILAASVFNSLQ